MKLTKTDKNMLKEWGYSEEDIPQIEKVIRVSNYFLYKNQEKSTSISSKNALELLGKELFLSGIARSAFHWNALRENDSIKVLFDSKKLFN